MKLLSSDVDQKKFGGSGACKLRYWEQMVSFYYKIGLCYSILPTNIELLLININRISYGLRFMFSLQLLTLSSFWLSMHRESRDCIHILLENRFMLPLTVKEVMHRPPFEALSLASSISASLQIWHECNITI